MRSERWLEAGPGFSRSWVVREAQEAHENSLKDVVLGAAADGVRGHAAPRFQDGSRASPRTPPGRRA